MAWLLGGCASTSTIHTEPVGAEVFINGERCGTSPCIHHTRYGFPDRMRVQLEKPGYETAEFFVDTEAPIGSYALFVVGSYIFHTFDEEYHFRLKPRDAQAAAVPAAATTPTTTAPSLDPQGLVNAVEQCLFWAAQPAEGKQAGFFARSLELDCAAAKAAVLAAPAASRSRADVAASILELWARMGERLGLSLSKEELAALCPAAALEFARRLGAGEAASPALERGCPEQHQQLSR